MITSLVLLSANLTPDPAYKYNMPLQFPKPEEPTGVSTTNIPAEDNTSLPPATNPSTGAKTAEQEEADRLYEERIEEEYAKREGGA
ncbi:hypothetical protein BP6252_10043 [Coleophoma cylindrospora]|uniref:Uncharacterized protein n=1 Tax=Coleophoma cylindrospora TaxID=1849047 RepID=A0A3D8QXK0_9HELO|nr:hypothetical protein BP6252_10043 [Coleophoma cylindrospora]